MILLAYRHGLRVSELVDLQWTQVSFASAVPARPQAKNGTPATHPLTGIEMRALRRLQREQEPSSPFVFCPSAARRSRPKGSAVCCSVPPRPPG